MIKEIKAIYKKDKKLACEVARVLGYKIKVKADKPNKKEIEQARQFGEDAFLAGKKALPYTCKRLGVLLKNRQVGEGLPLLKAWEKGWNKANIKGKDA